MDIIVNLALVCTVICIYLLLPRVFPDSNHAFLLAIALLITLGIPLMLGTLLSLFHLFHPQIMWAIQAGLLLLSLSCLLKVRLPSFPEMTLTALSPWSSVILLLIAGAALLSVCFGLNASPYTFDAITYHLPQAHHILHFHGFSNYIQNDIENWTAFQAGYPKTWPLILLILNGLTSHTRLLNLFPLYFALMSILSIASMARDTGANRTASVTAAGTFLLIPMVGIHLNVLMDNLAQAALTLTCFALMVRYQSSKNQLIFPLFGLAAGMAVGMKCTAFIIAIILPIAMVWSPENRFSQLRKSIRLSPVYAGALLFFFSGGIYYLFNWIRFNNPIYPIQFSVGGISIFRGLISPAGYLGSVPAAIVHMPRWRQLIHSFYEIQIPEYSHSIRWGGLGKPFSWFILPASTLILTLLIIKRKNIPLQRLLLLGLTVTLLTPMFFWTRFIIFFPGICLVALAWAMSRKRLEIPILIILTLFSIRYWGDSILPLGYTSEYNRISIIRMPETGSRSCSDFLLRFNRHSCRYTQDLQSIRQVLNRSRLPASVFLTSGKHTVPSFPLTGLNPRIKMTILCRNGCHSPVPIPQSAYFIYPHRIKNSLNIKSSHVLFKGNYLEMVALEPGEFTYNERSLQYDPY